MSIKARIIDSASGLEACVVDEAEHNALVVATRPLKVNTGTVRFFINDTYGPEMAQNGAYGGTPVLLSDGEDTSAWNFSEPVGTKWVADSTDQAYTGTQSMKFDNGKVGDIMQLLNNVGPGNNIDLTGNYVAFTMWVYISANWADNDNMSLYGYLTDTGTQVGIMANLRDYLPVANLDQWQFVNIPLTDMELEAATIDSIRIENVERDGARSPLFYIDDFQLEETGTPVEFELKPEPGTWLYIESYQTTFVDAYDGTLLNGTGPNLSYNKLLDYTATTGYVFRQFSDDQTIPLTTLRIINLFDALQLPESEITNFVSDGTNTMVTIKQTQPKSVILKSELADKITITIEDDFSQFIHMIISIQGTVEQRNQTTC